MVTLSTNTASVTHLYLKCIVKKNQRIGLHDNCLLLKKCIARDILANSQIKSYATMANLWTVSLLSDQRSKRSSSGNALGPMSHIFYFMKTWDSCRQIKVPTIKQIIIWFASRKKLQPFHFKLMVKFAHKSYGTIFSPVFPFDVRLLLLGELKIGCLASVCI